ncbi:MAG: T9SS type A sorting domain-containing protein [Bacteroidales bacterium]|nr:T9SS type A sorting domain-containing protein [Bacteroidales bacterium]
MKNGLLVLAIFCLAMVQTAFSQDINLKFTGATNNGKYVQLDSVKVENISRSWTETLYYPDTVLTLTNTTSISDMGNNTVSACLSYPNPFNGTSNIALALPQSGNVSLQVYNIAGQQILAKNLYMESGENHLEISLQHPQVYLLVAHTANGRFVQKLINTGHSSGNNIAYNGTLPNQEKSQVKKQKLLSTKDFQPEDTLKIVGYITHNGNPLVSQEILQAQTASEDFTLYFTLPGNSFSVSDTTRIIFSPGNLQWSATNGGSTPTTHAVAGGGTAEGTWRFASNQWDTIGANNQYCSDSYSGWIDLFGWGTSGYDNKYPYMTSTMYSDYGEDTADITGTNADWGTYNAIYNPQTQTTDAPGMWRTLTKNEWTYLINTRSTTSGIRYAKAVVNGVNGLIIVPDNWESSIYALDSTNMPKATYASNTINSIDWINIEDAGAVFLPAAGCRNGTSARVVGTHGYYWSGSYDNYIFTHGVYFNPSDFSPSSTSYPRPLAMAVRLVRSAQ